MRSKQAGALLIAVAVGVGIRHYERAGLVAARRAPNGYRDFTTDAVARVADIRTLLAHGFGVRDAGGLLACVAGRPHGTPPCAAALDGYARKVRELDRRIAELAEVRDRARAGLAALRRARR